MHQKIKFRLVHSQNEGVLFGKKMLAKSAVLDEMDCYEPAHLDLHYLPKPSKDGCGVLRVLIKIISTSLPYNALSIL